MFKAYHLKFSTRGPTSKMVKTRPRHDPGRARGTPGFLWVPPKKGPQRGSQTPGIDKQVIDCEKLSTSDVEIGYCV